MNYQDAFDMTGWDLLGMFWWIGLIILGLIVGRYAKWINPK